MSRNPWHRQNVNSSSEVAEFYSECDPGWMADERTIHVQTIVSHSTLNHWSTKPHHYRDIHQILLLERGGVAASVDTYAGNLQAPGALIVPPGSVFSFRFRAGTEGLLISFSVPLARRLVFTVPAILDLLQQPSRWEVERSVLRTTDLQALAHLLLREFSRSTTGRGLALYGLLSAFLSSLLRMSQGAIDDVGKVAMRETEIVAAYRQLLEDSYRQHLEISSYARKLGISETFLRRACHSVVRQSPIEMIHQRLILEADRQLRYTSMTISQIASSLGFEDPAYFSRFFSRRKGTSPKAFREKLAL